MLPLIHRSSIECGVIIMTRTKLQLTAAKRSLRQWLNATAFSRQPLYESFVRSFYTIKIIKVLL